MLEHSFIIAGESWQAKFTRRVWGLCFYHHDQGSNMRRLHAGPLRQLRPHCATTQGGSDPREKGRLQDYHYSVLQPLALQGVKA